MATLLLGFMILIASSGCGDFNIRAGQPLNLDGLETELRIGESTRVDVLRVLGKPHGGGRALLPIDEKPRTVWTYYYEKGLVSLGGGESDARRAFLFVYFKGDRYDGHMWFSSLLEHARR